MTAFLLLTLAFAVQATFETRRQIADTFARQAEIQQSQIQLEELLRLQIDEENSLRGYSLTRDRSTSASTVKPRRVTTRPRTQFAAR